MRPLTEQEIADAFVLDYLTKDIEFMDVVEFLEQEGFPEDTSETEIHRLVTATLDTIAQRWEDADR